jgi:hypothetical protein
VVEHDLSQLARSSNLLVVRLGILDHLMKIVTVSTMFISYVNDDKLFSL